MADLISLKEFRKQIERAVLDEHAETLERSIHRLRAAEAKTAAMDRGDATVPQAAEAPTVSVSTLAAQEFEGMKGFLVQLYEGTSCDHSFLDAAGNAIDCLPFDQQPTVKAAREEGHRAEEGTPTASGLDHPAEFGINSMDSGPKPTGMVAPLRQGRVDLYGNKVATPAGTVPFRRLTLARLAQVGRLAPPFQEGPRTFMTRARFSTTGRLTGHLPRSLAGMYLSYLRPRILRMLTVMPCSSSVRGSNRG